MLDGYNDIAIFKNAFRRLEDAVKTYNQRALSDPEEQGLSKAFGYTHVSGCNTFKYFLKEQGRLNLYSSEDATRPAFTRCCIDDDAICI